MYCSASSRVQRARSATCFANQRDAGPIGCATRATGFRTGGVTIRHSVAPISPMRASLSRRHSPRDAMKPLRACSPHRRRRDRWSCGEKRRKAASEARRPRIPLCQVLVRGSREVPAGAIGKASHQYQTDKAGNRLENAEGRCAVHRLRDAGVRRRAARLFPRRAGDGTGRRCRWPVPRRGWAVSTVAAAGTRLPSFPGPPGAESHAVHRPDPWRPVRSTTCWWRRISGDHRLPCRWSAPPVIDAAHDAAGYDVNNLTASLGAWAPDLLDTWYVARKCGRCTRPANCIPDSERPACSCTTESAVDVDGARHAIDDAREQALIRTSRPRSRGGSRLARRQHTMAVPQRDRHEPFHARRLRSRVKQLLASPGDLPARPKRAAIGEDRQRCCCRPGCSPTCSPLVRQVQIACDFAKERAGAAGGGGRVRYDDAEQSHRRAAGAPVSRTVAFIDGLDVRRVRRQRRSHHPAAPRYAGRGARSAAEGCRRTTAVAFPDDVTTAYAPLLLTADRLGRRKFVGAY